MLWRGLRSLFSYSWKFLDGLRRGVHLVLMLLVLAAVFAVVANRPGNLPEAFVLELSPSGALVEQYSGDPLDRAVQAVQGAPPDQVVVGDLVEIIENAARDKRVKAIHLELDGLQGGSLDKLERVATALQGFRDSGKPVVASGANIEQARFYLGAHADEFYLDPAGGVFFQGYGFYRNYYAEALDKLSVDWHVFAAGEAKSYGNPYVRDSMSDPVRENLQPIADGLWSEWRGRVAAARGLEPSLLDDYIERLVSRLRAADGDTALAAVDAGLVDGVRTFAELESRLAETGGRDGDGDYRGVAAAEYLLAQRADLPGIQADEDAPAVGLIVAQGNISPGYQPPGSIGDASLRQLLRRAGEDDDVHAVLLRVDSGGGSALASEAILREIQVIREAGKPVVVSMGGVAASGGYMISLAADEIWAHPTTITGSIGVVAMFPNFGRALEKIGVGVDGVGTHSYTGDFRLDRPLGEEVKELIELVVEGTYTRFRGLVAENRGLEPAEIRRYAEGRVWLGEVAREAGLVDRVGTLDDALASAAEMAGLDTDFRVEKIELSEGFGERLMAELLTRSARAGLIRWPRSWLEDLPAPIRGVAQDLERLNGLSDPRGLYYHCFCDSW